MLRLNEKNKFYQFSKLLDYKKEINFCFPIFIFFIIYLGLKCRWRNYSFFCKAKLSILIYKILSLDLGRIFKRHKSGRIHFLYLFPRNSPGSLVSLAKHNFFSVTHLFLCQCNPYANKLWKIYIWRRFGLRVYPTGIFATSAFLAQNDLLSTNISLPGALS